MGVRGVLHRAAGKIARGIEARKLQRLLDRHHRQALALCPLLGTFASAREGYRGELAATHQHYVTSVSSDRMAMSLDCAALLAHLCRELAPSSVLDLGSGYSSYVVRRYCASAGTRIVSVDDNAEWLSRTAEYLASTEMPTRELYTWEDFRQLERARRSEFHLVFHDLGNMPLRAESLDFVLGTLRHPGGILLLDDMHKKPFRTFASSTLAKRQAVFFHLARLLIDDHSRWPTLVVDIGASSATPRLAGK